MGANRRRLELSTGESWAFGLLALGMIVLVVGYCWFLFVSNAEPDSVPIALGVIGLSLSLAGFLKGRTYFKGAPDRQACDKQGPLND